MLDNKALQAVYEDLWNKQNSSDKEQGGFLYMNELNSYSFFELTDQFVTVRTKYKLEFHLPSGLPPGSIYIHTHPNENNITDFGIINRYKHKPSDEDKDMIEQMDHVVDYGLIIDPLYRIVYDSDGNTVIKATRCGY